MIQLRSASPQRGFRGVTTKRYTVTITFEVEADTPDDARHDVLDIMNRTGGDVTWNFGGFEPPPVDRECQADLPTCDRFAPWSIGSSNCRRTHEVVEVKLWGDQLRCYEDRKRRGWV